MEKYIAEEMLKENINRKIFYLVDANSFVAKDSSDYTNIQFNQLEIMNEKGYTSGAIDCSIDLYDDEIIYLSAAKKGYISPSQGIWNPSIMSIKKAKISMKPFIQNEDKTQNSYWIIWVPYHKWKRVDIELEQVSSYDNMYGYTSLKTIDTTNWKHYYVDFPDNYQVFGCYFNSLYTSGSTFLTTIDQNQLRITLSVYYLER